MRIPAAMLLVFALAACRSSTLPNDPRQLPEVITPKPTAQSMNRTGYVAHLRPIGGSSAQGTVTVSQRDDVVVIDLSIANLASGTYTWALHETGNCSSPNGFSAGGLWAPKGAKQFPVDLLPEFVAKDDQQTSVTARVRGARVDGDGGIVGRSVLLYQGASIHPIKPGVPNNAIACGVFEPARTLF